MSELGGRLEAGGAAAWKAALRDAARGGGTLCVAAFGLTMLRGGTLVSTMLRAATLAFTAA
ncbi:MAG: hypothetical protein ACXW5U_13065 [Thermoanaerobaculia bacterium]